MFGAPFSKFSRTRASQRSTFDPHAGPSSGTTLVRRRHGLPRLFCILTRHYLAAISSLFLASRRLLNDLASGPASTTASPTVPPAHMRREYWKCDDVEAGGAVGTGAKKGGGGGRTKGGVWGLGK